MSYAIGLDCGITSVGYAVMDLDDNGNPRRIIHLGSRIFPAAEHPKDGSSLALPRREARSTRRRLRRHKHRLERIRYMIVDEEILTQEQMDQLYSEPVSDIYMLRVNALDRPLTNEEFSRVLIHLAQRRGFKSNRKVDKEDKENSKLLTAVSGNTLLMEEKGYRTVGEMFAKDEKFILQKRNKAENYTNTVSRDMVEDEVHKIFAAQREHGCPFAAETIENRYVDILFSQRSFEEGPGGDSPYGGNQIEKMIGRCTFFPEEQRAAKATYSFQYFSLLQAVNHIRVITEGSSRELRPDERRIVLDAAFKTDALTFKKIRAELGLADSDRFKNVYYRSEDKEEWESKTKFQYLRAYHEMRKKFDKLNKGHINSIDRSDLDEIGYALTVYKTDDNIISYLKEHTALNKEEIDAVLMMPSFSKFGHISVKACKAIIPGLEQGMTYDKACESAGITFRGHDVEEKGLYLPANPQDAPELDDINNPVVRRAVSQTIKVINAIIREQGESPVYLNLELAREMSKSFQDRQDIKKSYDENSAKNEIIKEEIVNHFGKTNPSGQDILKLKLYYEQQGISPYSQKVIVYDRLFEPGYVDIDHIVPYSVCFDDSFRNKVLVFSSENREKGNRVPLDYLRGEEANNFVVYVNASVKDFKKKQRLLRSRPTDEDIKGFKERNLNDTKYLSRFLLNFIQDHLQFSETGTKNTKRVTSVNGSVTAYMRKRWGISKIRENGDLHHAADAAVIACVTDGMINRVSRWSKYHETEYEVFEGESYAIDPRTGEVLDKFPLPYPEFRKELDARLFDNEEHMHDALVSLKNYRGVDLSMIHPCFVSRMPNHKVTGPAHQDTVRSPRHYEEDGIVIAKTALQNLKLKDGEIDGYYKPESDRLLYEALKARLIEFGGDGKKAFKDDFYKPKADGSQGPLVRKVKTFKKSSLNVPVNNGKGVADNGSMVRIDVFFVPGDGYYFVPIYVADVLKKELPDKASVASKPYSEWKVMEDQDFLFSLYPHDLIRVEKKSGHIKLSLSRAESTLPKTIESTDFFLYFRAADIGVASIIADNHDGSYYAKKLGIKTLKCVEKYQVDVLGNYYKVGREKRQRFRL